MMTKDADFLYTDDEDSDQTAHPDAHADLSLRLGLHVRGQVFFRCGSCVD